ncbi:MAG: aminotransferase class V-fold PLP-dependent enzyme, partial [Planctomycetaceae bacterium]
LDELRERGTIRLTTARSDAQGRVDLDQLLDAVDAQTSLVALAHGSNVTGAVQDVAVVGDRLRETSTLFLCDAAQTLGYLPIDVRSMGIDLLAAPGHKGAGGPLGTALLYVSPKAAERLRPTLFGGTGSISESLKMPAQFPDRLEAGNLNVPAIAGWHAGLKQLRSIDPLVQQRHLADLCGRMTHALAGFERGLVIAGTELPIASIVFDDVEPNLIGSLLDSEYSIDVRCGLHCAALVHEAIRSAFTQRGTRRLDDYQGTLRISAGHLTSPEQIDEAAAAINELMSELSASTQ